MSAYYHANAFPTGPLLDFISSFDNTSAGSNPRAASGGPEHCRSRPQHRNRHPCGGQGYRSSPDAANLNPFLQQLFSQFAPEATGANPTSSSSPQTSSDSSTRSFTPPLDVFSTPSAYILHVSLPGAQRSDIGLNYNADATELSIAGVVHRPGDEEFLKTIVAGAGERAREVGMFERKVKLGDLPHGHEAQEEGSAGGAAEVEIDADGITAKLEDGLLVVTVPKVEKFVEIKKVDIE
ncbi:MAG: hypothetical protein M1837_005375 [Sclerophora amabilis]|nr:MAG: hypothetical protein M1837_005375 [Sclerophora amabilis]